MKVKTFTFLNSKRYLFSFIVILSGLFSSVSAFSQVDYFYGLNKKGFRVSIGGGAGILDSNWGKNSPGAVGTADVDYDWTQYFSIGLHGDYGILNGKDSNNKLTPGSTKVTFGGGDLNFKLAVGQLTDFNSKTFVFDIIKRIYVGTGIGIVASNVILKPHSFYSTQAVQNQYSHYLEDPSMRNNIETNQQAKGSGSFTYVPINVGTYITLRKFLKKDKLELNPNYQYSFVQSPVFDGYRPSTTSIGAVTKNGNQAYMIISLALRYKF